MTDLLLVRTASLPEATTGYLDLPNGKRLYSIEPPARGNEPNTSCVPAGKYELVPYDSPEHGPVYYLRNHALGVGAAGERRSYCELHSANWARQLRGCVAFGLDDQPMLDPSTGCVEPAVENSRDAIGDLYALLDTGVVGHTLTIRYLEGADPNALM